MPLLYLMAEILIFVLLVQILGFGWALLLAIIPSFLGLLLLSVLGREMAVKMQSLIRDGKTQPADILRSSAPLIGAVLLIIPGFISRSLGILFLFPPTRWLLLFLASRLFFSRLLKKSFSSFQFGNGAFRVYTNFGQRTGFPSEEPRDVTANSQVIDVVPTKIEHKTSTQRNEDDDV